MPKRKPNPDPIGAYIEWTYHRYDPGYYLGGNISPFLRKSTLGENGRLLSGLYLLTIGIPFIGFVMSIANASDFPIPGLAISLGVALLIVSAAAAMLRASTDRSHDRAHNDPR
jgi:hypothetical protein